MNYEALINFIKVQRDEAKVTKQDLWNKKQNNEFELAHEYFNGVAYQNGKQAAYKELKAFINFLKKNDKYGEYIQSEEQFIPTDDDLIGNDNEYNYEDLIKRSF